MSSTDSSISESSKQYLSTTKYAAARKGEESDTIIVWDEKVMEGSSGGSQRWRAFGIKGRENLENLYFGILSMLQKNYKSIAKASKFPAKSLNALLSSLNSADKEFIESNYMPPSDKDKKPYIMGDLELRLNISDSYPRLGLFLREKEEDGNGYVTGIYLFSNELVKLIKHMNNFYKIGSTEFKTYEITDRFDFF